MEVILTPMYLKSNLMLWEIHLKIALTLYKSFLVFLHKCSTNSCNVSNSGAYHLDENNVRIGSQLKGKDSLLELFYRFPWKGLSLVSFPVWDTAADERQTLATHRSQYRCLFVRKRRIWELLSTEWLAPTDNSVQYNRNSIYYYRKT